MSQAFNIANQGSGGDARRYYEVPQQAQEEHVVNCSGRPPRSRPDSRGGAPVLQEGQQFVAQRYPNEFNIAASGLSRHDWYANPETQAPLQPVPPVSAEPARPVQDLSGGAPAFNVMEPKLSAAPQTLTSATPAPEPAPVPAPAPEPVPEPEAEPAQPSSEELQDPDDERDE